MIRRNTVTEAAEALAEIPDAPETTVPADLVPLAELAAEGFGWGSPFVKSPRDAIRVLARQLEGAVYIDALGRRCTDWDTAHRLIAERDERERRQREEQQRQAELAKRPRPEPRGVPVPEGFDGDALTVLKLADSGAKPGELTYHPMPDPDEPRVAGEFYRIEPPR